MALAGCGQSAPVIPPSQEGISIQSSLILDVGDTFTLYPEFLSGFTGNNNFRFVSSNQDICDVDNEGTITCYYPGEAIITTFCDDNYNNIKDGVENYGTTKITVNPVDNPISATNIYISSMCEDAFPQSTYYLKSTVLPNDTTYRKLRYVSSDPTVSEVDELTGQVYNWKAGDSVITVYNDVNNNKQLDEGELHQETVFAVRDPEEAYSISVEQTNVTIAVGESYVINPTIYPSTSAYFGYSSSNTEVAQVTSGTVVGLFPGTSTIEVRCKGAYAYIKLTVIEATSGGKVKAAKIDINEPVRELDIGDTLYLYPHLIPSHSEETITYSSNNPEIASVDEDGIVTANEAGSAIITAKVSNTVYDTLSVVVGEENTYDGNYYNGYYNGLTWTDSKDLENKLHTLIRTGYTALGYANPTNWETNQYADEDINDTTMVNALYSNDPIEKSKTNTGWQREHVFCATLFTGVSTATAVASKGRATDFHNLFAAAKAGNTSRGNKQYGYAVKALPSYQDKTSYLYDVNNFEPTDEDKGKVARAIFYDTIMYNCNETETVKESWRFITEEDIKSHSSASKTVSWKMNYKPANVVEGHIDYNRVTLNEFMAKSTPAVATLYDRYEEVHKAIGSQYEEGTDNYRIEVFELYCNDYASSAIGNLSTLVEWNAFKVDAQEAQHCQSIYSHEGINVNKGLKQGNRNPFVDYPQLVDYLFGCLKDVPGSINKLKPSILDYEN